MGEEHDSLCWASRGGLGCICKDLRAARADERERVADRIHKMAFEVFTASDGNQSIGVHEHHEGLTLAEQLVRETNA